MSVNSSNWSPNTRRPQWWSITPAWDARWTQSSRLRPGVASRLSKTTHTACSAAIAVSTWALSAAWPLRAFTKRRISAAARVGRSSSMTNGSSSAPKWCVRREQIGAVSSVAWSTNTPGPILALAICRQTCWPPFCSPNLRHGLRSSRNAERSGGATVGVSPTGPHALAPHSHSFRPTASRPTTCSTSSCRRWKLVSG